MALRVPFSPVLDGGPVDIGDGSASKRSIRIEAGEYTTPFWLRTESGLVIPVTELPWQGVVDDAELEVLSGAPGAGGGGTLLADVQWTTALGSSTTATSDGGVATIDEGGSGGQVLAVEAPETYGWDALGDGNVLSILQTADSWGHVVFEDLFPLPVNGEEQFWAMRYYHLVEEGVDENQDHPHCLWPVGQIEFVHLAIVVQSGGVGASLGASEWLPRAIGGDEGVFTGGAFPFGLVPKTAGGSIIPFDKGVWHRFEHIFHWLNATEFRWYPRAYNMAGTLLYDQYGMKHTDLNESLGDWYDASASNVLTRRDTSDGVNHIRSPSFGRGQTNPDSGFHYCVADARFELRSSITDFIGA